MYNLILFIIINFAYRIISIVNFQSHKKLDFTYSYTQTQSTAETGNFTCWGVVDGSLVTTMSAVTKLVWRFGIYGWFAPET